MAGLMDVTRVEMRENEKAFLSVAQMADMLVVSLAGQLVSLKVVLTADRSAASLAGQLAAK